MKYIKNILRENLLLTENVQQAEKLLTSKNIPLDDRGYMEFKNLLIKNNNVGLLGPIVKMVVEDNGAFDFEAASNLYNQVKAQKSNLHLLPRPFAEYNYDGIMSAFARLPVFVLMQKLSKKLTNPKLKEQLDDWAMAFNIHGTHFEDRLKFFFNSTDGQTRKDILRTSDRFQDVYEFLDLVSQYQKKFSKGLEYNSILEKVKKTSKYDVEVVFKDESRKLILLRILTFKGATQVGNMVWCIARDRADFNAYTGFGDMAQYFLYHFEENVPDDAQAIAFTLTPERLVPASMNRSNRPFPNVLGHLNSLGIDPSKLKVPKPEVDLMGDFGDYGFGESLRLEKIIRESLEHLDLFHLQDTLFQYFQLDEADGPVEQEMSSIINDISLLNHITQNPKQFLKYKNSKIPRKKALYLIVDKFLDY